MRRLCVNAAMSRKTLAALAVLVAVAAPRVRADEPPPVASAVAGEVPAVTADPQEPAPPAKKRFEEQVEVVAPGPRETQAPAELAVRPTTVMAVAGSADNVFRTLQTLPGIAATTEFDSRISVRGGSPDENLTIMDGVEIHNPYRLFGLTSAFNPETVRSFDLYAGAFSSKYGDRLSSLLVVENRPGSDAERFSGSTAVSLTDANAVFEGRLPGEGKGSWIVTGRRTYYDLVANSLVGTELPAFGDLQGRLDWNLRPGTRLTFFGLLSREATDAFFEGDRAGEQGDFVTSARNDLAALKLTTLLGRSVSSRTIASFYLNRDDIGANAQFRNEAQRSNAPSDEVGFGLADIAFSRQLGVRDLALRQELALAKGAHLVETGLEVHQLRTDTAWLIEGDRNPTASNGSSVQGGAGLPSDLDSAVDSTRLGAWLQDRWQAGESLSFEAGLRLDWSGVNRRTTLSPRASATLRLGDATRLRAGGGLFTQSPGYEKLIQSDYFVDLSGDLGRSLLYERAAHAVVSLERDLGAGLSARVEGYWKGLDDLIVGRLETEEERLARVGQYDFPAELASSVPTDPIITSFPVNGATGTSWGFDVLVQKRPTPGARLTGLGVLHLGPRAARGVRAHAALRVRPAARGEPRGLVEDHTEVGGGRDRCARSPGSRGRPCSGCGSRPDATDDGRLVPALDAEGRYVYETQSGGVSNLNTARLPAFFRLDLRLSWKPRGDAGRWLLYLDVINATNRDNVGQVDPRLAYDPESALDQPRLFFEPTAAIPFLPSIGVRFRF